MSGLQRRFLLFSSVLIALSCLVADDTLSVKAFLLSSATTTRKAFARKSALSVGQRNRLEATLSTETEYSFIQVELRGAAMRLHTKEQAPKEGQVASKPRKEYTPTHADYLAFLVDSQHVYQAFEDIVDERDSLEMFRNTGLERVDRLETDIFFMIEEYGLERPAVGSPGLEYAERLRKMQSIPEFICHFYNFYFAHTAGGRMIGKQMSSLLLNKKTLEFYKWDGDLNEIKNAVKENIETMAASWSPEERKECVDATAAAFQGGGAINSYLSGGQA